MTPTDETTCITQRGHHRHQTTQTVSTPSKSLTQYQDSRDSPGSSQRPTSQPVPGFISVTIDGTGHKENPCVWMISRSMLEDTEKEILCVFKVVEPYNRFRTLYTSDASTDTNFIRTLSLSVSGYGDDGQDLVYRFATMLNGRTGMPHTSYVSKGCAETIPDQINL